MRDRDIKGREHYEGRLPFPVREVIAHLPAWFFIYNAWYLAAMAMEDLPGGPRPRLTLTAGLTLLPPLAFYAARTFRRDDLRRKWTFYATLCTLCLGGVAVAILTSRWSLKSHGEIVWAHEIHTWPWVAALMAHCALTRGRRELVRFFGIGLLYAILLESGGITNGFFSEEGYALYLPRFLEEALDMRFAPVTTILGWTTVFYPTIYLVEELFRRGGAALTGVRSAVAMGVTASVFGVMIDLQVDPLATEVGLWYWNDLLAEGPHLLGVPVLNFVSWFFAVAPFAAAYFFITARPGWTDRRRDLVLLAAVPVSLGISSVFVFSTMGLIEGLDGPTWRILMQGIRAMAG